MWVCSSREQVADDAVIWVCLKSSARCVLTPVRPGGVCSCCSGAGCRMQGVTAGELSYRTWRMGGFAGSEGHSPVILGKTLLGWWELQESWWDGALSGLESGSRERDAAGGTGGLG